LACSSESLSRRIRTKGLIGKTPQKLESEWCSSRQAMILLETQARRSRRDGEGLVYVEYLAAVPHSRPSAKARKYKRCGEAMLALALERSRALGYKGRLGLHSLPTSVAFYVRLGLEDLGEDPAENGLRYFELGPDVLESGE